MRILISLLLPIGLMANVYADAEGQMWGRKAGDYLSAVVMASEFKKTICGQYLNVPDTWVDVSYARQNILKKLPSKYHGEFNVAFNPNEEVQMRQEMKSMIFVKDKSKCQEFANGVKDLITPRIRNW